jgi:hypothetical protein
VGGACALLASVAWGFDEPFGGLSSSTPAVIVNSVPPSGAIDARQPSHIDGSEPQGWDSITLHFNRAVLGATPADFSFQQWSTVDGIAVSGVQQIDANSVLLTLSEPMQPGTTATLWYGPSSIRLGYLPGDVNGDGIVGLRDALTLVDAINGIITLPAHASDINRDGQVDTHDIDRLQALLNGTGGMYEVWNGQHLDGPVALPVGPGPDGARELEVVLEASYPNGDCGTPGDTVTIDVFLRRVEMGDDIRVRGLQFDTALTHEDLQFEFPLTHSVPTGDIFFWDFVTQAICTLIPSQCGGQHFLIDDLNNDPFLSITYTDTAQSDDFQLLIPGDGTTLHVGQMDIELPMNFDPPYVLDLLNQPETAPNEGGYLVFGFGFEGDPITTWRADAGEIIGGVMEICTVAQSCDQADFPDEFCSDGDVCNGEETCDLETGLCLAGDPPSCEDDLFCNGDEQCDPETGCFSPGDPCISTNQPICDEDADQCVQCLTDEDCDVGLSCQAGVCVGDGGAKLSLNPDAFCYGWGDPVFIIIDLQNSPAPIVGGEFFIAYNPDALDFMGSDPGEPWEVEIFNNVDEDAGTVDLAVHVPFNPPGTGDTMGTMATLNFIAREDFCGDTPVEFRENNPPTRLTTLGGDDIQPEKNDTEIDLFDPAAELDCPDDVVAEAPIDQCETEMCFPDIGSGGDGPGESCGAGAGSDFTCVASHPEMGEFPLDPDGCAVFPEGDTTITCVSDGNCEALCEWSVTVECVDADNKLTLEPDQTCYGWGDVVTVEVLIAAEEPVAGGQFFMEYDPTALDYFSAEPGEPWVLEIFSEVDEPAGTIDYAVGVPFGEEGATSGVMATITFIAIQDFCGETEIVWREHNPPTRVTNGVGQPLDTDCNDAALSLIDPLTSMSCPADLETPADAGQCTAHVCWVNPMSGGACGDMGDLPCSAAHEGGDEIEIVDGCGDFPIGTTTITCGSEGCGGGGCTWTITVTEDNVVTTEIELSPIVVPGPVARCIHLSIYPEDCGDPIEIEADMVFGVPDNIPMHTTGEFLVPCGAYECATAMDPLHTLRSKVDGMDIIEQVVVDGQYEFVRQVYFALFKGNPAVGGNWLWSGNLNGDCVIDVLDFGVFIGQYPSDFGTGDTDCQTEGPHADINGDGVVDPDDYWFIANNFLVVQKANCCDAVGEGCNPDGGARGKSGLILDSKGRVLSVPATGQYEHADLNGDGVLNMTDMEIFEAGASPAPSFRPRHDGRDRPTGPAQF